MEAPDKIFVAGAMETEVGLFGVWTDKDHRDTPYCQYIRKEALLEKLEKVAAEYKKRSDEGELVWQNMCGVNEAINILNSI